MASAQGDIVGHEVLMINNNREVNKEVPGKVNDGINKIIEQNIKRAMKQGTFNNLPGQGKPLQLTDISFVPPEQRAAFLVMQNSGSLPPEMELRKEIASLEEKLQMAGEEEKADIQKKLTEKKMFYDVFMERRKG